LPAGCVRARLVAGESPAGCGREPRLLVGELGWWCEERRGERQVAPERRVAAEPTRRLLLAVAAAGSLGLAGSLTGCKGITALGQVPKAAPDIRTLEHAIAAEEGIVDRYRAALRQLSASSAGQAGSSAGQAGLVVAAIADEHEAHLRQLRERLLLPPRLAKTKISPSRDLAPLPDDRSGVLGALAALERTAVARLTSQLIGVPPALAQLMASISASEAAHVVILRRAGSA
jgi:Ferritin-like domain